MEDTIRNQGLDHLASKIFGYLDLDSLRESKKVSTFWKEFIENQRFYWIEELNVTKRSEVMQSIFKNYQNWQAIFKQFEEDLPLDKLEEFAEYMKVFEPRHKLTDKYSWRICECRPCNPILNAAYRGELEFLKLLNSCKIKLNDKSWSGFTALHWACKEGHLEMVNFLLKEKSIQKAEMTLHFTWS